MLRLNLHQTRTFCKTNSNIKEPSASKQKGKLRQAVPHFYQQAIGTGNGKPQDLLPYQQLVKDMPMTNLLGEFFGTMILITFGACVVASVLLKDS